MGAKDLAVKGNLLLDTGELDLTVRTINILACRFLTHTAALLPLRALPDPNIILDPQNPRKSFYDGPMASLTRSIDASGLTITISLTLML